MKRKFLSFIAVALSLLFVLPLVGPIATYAAPALPAASVSDTFVDENRNVALYKEVTVTGTDTTSGPFDVSVEDAPGNGWGPSFVVDGYKSTETGHTSGLMIKNATLSGTHYVDITIDLAGVYTVNKYEITKAYSDGTAAMPRSIEIAVSTDGTEYTKVAAVSDALAIQETLGSGFNATEARYVRVRITKDSGWNPNEELGVTTVLGEIEVFGVPATGDTWATAPEAVEMENSPLDTREGSLTYTTSADGKSVVISYYDPAKGETVSYTVPNSNNYLFGGYAGVGDYADANHSLADSNSVGAITTDQDRYVGLFYFLWHGDWGPLFNGEGQIENGGTAFNLENALQANGGSSYGANVPAQGHFAWFAEPLYGYYFSNDDYVLRKHAELLTNANVDFLYFDSTNAPKSYVTKAMRFMGILQEMIDDGWDTPQVVFYCNANALSHIQEYYDQIYSQGLYEDTWFKIDGKPVIVAPTITNVPGADGTTQVSVYDAVLAGTTKVEDVFTLKHTQWPDSNEANIPWGTTLNWSQTNNSWPWIDFYWPQKVYYNGAVGTDGAINVSMAQHAGNGSMSDTVLGKNATYSKYNRGRSFVSNGYTSNRLQYSTSYSSDAFYKNANFTAYKSDATLSYQGNNFQEQFDYAISTDAKYILVTGWNEWIAQNGGTSDDPLFVDGASFEYSRDAEMTKGLAFDSYYMQLASNIQRVKGTAPYIIQDQRYPINVTGDFAQWNNIDMTYTDPKNDALGRTHTGFGSDGYQLYTNYTGRNDIVASKITSDTKNVYFYIETVNAITAYSTDAWMQLYVNADCNASTGWYGYDYIVNYQAADSFTTSIAKWNGSDWEEQADTVSYQVKGNKMMIEVPLDDLGFTDHNAVNFEFKVFDGKVDAVTMESFYTDGDAAPLGRFNYVYHGRTTDNPDPASPEFSADDAVGEVETEAAKQYVKDEKHVDLTSTSGTSTLALSTDASTSVGVRVSVPEGITLKDFSTMFKSVTAGAELTLRVYRWNTNQSTTVGGVVVYEQTTTFQCAQGDNKTCTVVVDLPADGAKNAITDGDYFFVWTASSGSAYARSVNSNATATFTTVEGYRNGSKQSNVPASAISYLQTTATEVTPVDGSLYTQLNKDKQHVIILAGQSNAAGNSGNNDLFLHDYENAAAHKAGYSNVKIWYNVDDYRTNNGTANFSSTYDRDSSSGSVIATQNDSGNAFVNVASGQGASNSDALFGIEVGLAAYLSKTYPGETFYIIKSAIGGSSLYDRTDKVDWTTDGYAWTNFQEDVPAALAQLDNPEIIAFMWMQGESDAEDATYTKNYTTNFTELMGRIDTLLSDKYAENGMALIDAAISVKGSWEYPANINAQKRAYAAAGQNRYYLDVANLTVGEDTAHYGALSMLSLSESFGKAVTQIIRNAGYSPKAPGASGDGSGGDAPIYNVAQGQYIQGYAGGGAVGSLGLGMGGLEAVVDGLAGNATTIVQGNKLNHFYSSSNPKVTYTFTSQSVKYVRINIQEGGSSGMLSIGEVKLLNNTTRRAFTSVSLADSANTTESTGVWGLNSMIDNVTTENSHSSGTALGWLAATNVHTETITFTRSSSQTANTIEIYATPFSDWSTISTLPQKFTIEVSANGSSWTTVATVGDVDDSVTGGTAGTWLDTTNGGGFTVTFDKPYTISSVNIYPINHPSWNTFATHDSFSLYVRKDNGVWTELTSVASGAARLAGQDPFSVSFDPVTVTQIWFVPPASGGMMGEFQVMGYDPAVANGWTNVTQGKNADATQQGNVLHWVGNWHPMYLTDGVVGNSAGLYYAVNGSPGLPTGQTDVYISLDDLCEIYSFAMYPAQYYNNGNMIGCGLPYAFTIDVSADGINFETAIAVSDRDSGALSYTLTTPVEARYIRLSVTGYDNIGLGSASISEFQAFGKVLPTTATEIPEEAGNVALNATVTKGQGTYSINNSDWPDSGMVDGISGSTGGLYFTNGDIANGGSFLQNPTTASEVFLDLGSTYTVYSFEMNPFQFSVNFPGGYGMPTSYTITGSTDGTNYNIPLYTAYAASEQGTHTGVFTEPADVRFVKITVLGYSTSDWGGGNWTGIGEFQLFGVGADVAQNVSLGKPVSASEASGGAAIDGWGEEFLTDGLHAGNTGVTTGALYMSGLTSNDGTNVYFTIDLKGTYDLTSFALFTSHADGNDIYALPRSYTVAVSTDGGSTFTTAATITGVAAAASTGTLNSTGVTHVRVTVTAPGGQGFTGIGEIQIMGTIAKTAGFGTVGTLDASLSYEVAADNAADSYPASKLNDGSKNTTGWKTTNMPGVTTVTMVLGEVKEVSALVLYPSSASTSASSLPRAFRIEVTTDGYTWDTVYEFSGLVAKYAANQGFTASFPKAHASQVRLVITAHSDLTYSELAELTVHGTAHSLHIYDKMVASADHLATAATCSTQATYYVSCLCGANGSETFSAGNYAAHNYVTSASPVAANLHADATCTAGAVYIKTCADCGKQGGGIYTVGNTVAHTVSETYINHPDYLISTPDCTTGGEYYEHCDVCSLKTGGTGTIAALGHTPVSNDDAVDATCTETGLTASTTCDVCGETVDEQETVEKLAHTPVTDDNAVEASCTETGLTASTSCSVCKNVITPQEEVETVAHTPVVDNLVEPTCTETGLTAGSHCSVCNVTIQAQTPVDAKGHTSVSDNNGVDATCTETGLTASTSCSVCKVTLTEQEEIPTSGHVYDLVYNPATGCREGSCTVCGGAPISEKVNEIVNVQVKAEEDLTVIYGATVDASAPAPTLTVTAPAGFEALNTTVTGVAGETSGNTTTYTFNITSVAPQYMDVEFTTVLKVGDVVQDEDTYSVAQYLSDLKTQEPDNAELNAMVNDMLVYGGAAQKLFALRNNTTIADADLVSNGVTGTAYTNVSGTDKAVRNNGTYAKFTAATMYYGAVPQIVFKTSNVAEGTTFKMGDVVVTPDANGYIYVDIDITAPDATYEITAYSGETAGATATYSVKSYAYACQSSGTMSAENIALGKALYTYCQSAVAYKEANSQN